jgi:hypothetical protein
MVCTSTYRSSTVWLVNKSAGRPQFHIPVHDRTYQYENSTFVLGSAYQYIPVHTLKKTMYFLTHPERDKRGNSKFCTAPMHGILLVCNKVKFQKCSSLDYSKYLIHTGMYRYIELQTSTKQHTSFDHAPFGLWRLRISADCLAWSVFTVFFLIKV